MAHDAKYGPITIPGIPDDEPVFILRARDTFSAGLLMEYARMLAGGLAGNMYGVDQRLAGKVVLEAVRALLPVFKGYKPKRLPG